MHRLKLFGGASIETETGPVTGRAAQRRRLALLALLAASRSHGMSRDKLIAYLWPDADAENGRRFLSDSVYRVNQALGVDAIVAAGDELRLDPRSLASDVGEFEDALARGDPAAAVALHSGAFLDGFFLSDAAEFERWAAVERDRFARAVGGALEALAESAERSSEATAATAWWRRLAAHDPYNSRVAIRLMRALDMAGERAAAIQHARIHETLLREELGLEPDSAVLTLAKRLKEPGYSGEWRVASGERGVGSALTPVPGRSGTPIQPGPSVASAPTLSSAPPATLSEVPAAAAPALQRSSSLRRRVPALIGAALGAAALLVVAVQVGRRAGNPPAPAADARAIAVLPFANIGADSANEYFSDGLTEELITTLGKTEGLEVASRTSVFAYKNRPVDVREVGKQLGVAAVVEGSVRKSGRQLRITAQLVSTDNGYRLWSEAYDREVDDAFSIQEEISRAIVAKLVGTPRDSGAVRTAGASTPDAEAYDLYLKGRYAWHQRTQAGLRAAVEYFSEAVARAPGYARAYVGLGDAWAVSAFYDHVAPRDAYPKAEAAARRAIALDATLAAPHATLGYVLTYYHLDWPGAEREFQRAIALDPSYSTAHQWYANLLTVAGRFDEAEHEMRLAQEADPLSLIANAALGWTFYHAGKHEAAVEQCRSTLALEPRFVLAHLWGGWALEALGRTSEAREWVGQAVTLSPGNPLARLALAHVLAGVRSEPARDSARAIVRAVEARAGRGEYVPSYEIGKVHLALGDRSAALDWLERAHAERSHSMAFVRVDPQLAPLRGDARFEALVERVMARAAREPARR